MGRTCQKDGRSEAVAVQAYMAPWANLTYGAPTPSTVYIRSLGQP